MHNFPARYLTIVLFITVSNALYAQTNQTSDPSSGKENNPYSRYGIGELWGGNSTSLKAMGNITSAYQNPFLINSDNPASYAALALTTFEGGAIGSTRHLTTSSGLSAQTGTISLAYLNIGVPVGKNAGMSFGLRPFARSYYSLADTVITAIGSTERGYKGEGGLSYAYLGGAYSYKGLSIGFNFGYLFGTYSNYTYSNNQLTDTQQSINKAYVAIFQKNTRYGGIYWKGGLMYEHKFADSNYNFRVGGTLTLGQNLNENVSNTRISYRYFSDTTVNDTSYSLLEQKGKLTLPVSYSAGVMFSRTDKWAFGLDYSATNWSTFKSTPDNSVTTGIGSSAYKVALGGEYTPNFADIKNYFARVTYRFGAYYGTDYVRLQSTTLPTYGITFGGSFPYKRTTRVPSRFHASFDIGRMGTQANNLIQQTYVRFGLGLSFNDKWFIQRKYD